MLPIIEIDPGFKYSKEDIKKFLCFSEKQLLEAEKRKLIDFSNNSYMCGLYFFQFLKANCKKLEEIYNGH